jgi:hypothetical protein
MSVQVLPGTNVNVVAGKRNTELSITGVATIPLALNWGDLVTVIDKDTDLFPILGYPRTAVEMKIINEILNGADKLILYRSNTDGGKKASGTLATNVIATAMYAGARGNDITVSVTESGSNPASVAQASFAVSV